MNLRNPCLNSVRNEYQRRGLSRTRTSGFGRVAVTGPRRLPLPPQRMTAYLLASIDILGIFYSDLGAAIRPRQHEAQSGDEPGPLFLTSNGHGQLMPEVALQPNGLKQMLRRLGRRTGIPKVHAHRFRHTFATWAIQHDARELDVQYLLGHSSPDMVRR